MGFSSISQRLFQIYGHVQAPHDAYTAAKSLLFTAPTQAHAH